MLKIQNKSFFICLLRSQVPKFFSVKNILDWQFKKCSKSQNWWIFLQNEAYTGAYSLLVLELGRREKIKQWYWQKRSCCVCGTVTEQSTVNSLHTTLNVRPNIVFFVPKKFLFILKLFLFCCDKLPFCQACFGLWWLCPKGFEPRRTHHRLRSFSITHTDI